MLLNYSIDTGLFIDLENRNQKGELGFNTISVSTNDPFSILSSLNSQTLFETAPEIQEAGFIDIINNSGDFYLTGYGLELDNTITGLDKNNLLYETTQSFTGIHNFFGDSGVLQTGAMNILSTVNENNDFNEIVFLNGQKALSGISYERVGTGYLWIDRFDITGRIFMLENSDSILEDYGTGNFDYVGDGFNKGSTKLYYNGLQQFEDSFLETSSVTPIETGFSAVLNTDTGGLLQFELNF